jgi:hypothetical protein
MYGNKLLVQILFGWKKQFNKINWKKKKKNNFVNKICDGFKKKNHPFQSTIPKIEPYKFVDVTRDNKVWCKTLWFQCQNERSDCEIFIL